jgi:hypothetical protein
VAVLGALVVKGASISCGSWRSVGLRALRDLAGVVSKPSVFKKAARLAGAGGSGINEI